MKTAVAVIALLASAEAFTVSNQSARSSTELFQYKTTKWTPQGGSSIGFSPAGASSNGASSYQATPIAEEDKLEYGGMVKTIVTIKGDYSTTKWSPQGGCNPVFSIPSATSAAAPVAAAAAPAASAGPSMADLAAAWGKMNQ
mmetsp:Transcript_2392/g.3229  ORF Transcript_2392/g.3229 Transcript_2392/m.3229 type:complete len:142 (+) Transcript_2392:157-582(+)